MDFFIQPGLLDPTFDNSLVVPNPYAHIRPAIVGVTHPNSCVISVKTFFLKHFESFRCEIRFYLFYIFLQIVPIPPLSRAHRNHRLRSNRPYIYSGHKQIVQIPLRH